MGIKRIRQFLFSTELTDLQSVWTGSEEGIGIGLPPILVRLGMTGWS